MVSHDAVAFYLLSQEVAKDEGGAVRQGADEVFGGYSWYPPMRDAPGDGLERYREQFFDRSHAELDRVLTPHIASSETRARSSSGRHFARPGAETLSTAPGWTRW